MIWQLRPKIITDVGQEVKDLSNFFNRRIHKLSIALMLMRKSFWKDKISFGWLMVDICCFMINDLLNYSSFISFLSKNIDFNQTHQIKIVSPAVIFPARWRRHRDLRSPHPNSLPWLQSLVGAGSEEAGDGALSVQSRPSRYTGVGRVCVPIWNDFARVETNLRVL